MAGRAGRKMDFARASSLGLALLLGTGSFVHAAPEIPATSFATAADALVSEIEGRRLSSFDARSAYPVAEWFAPAGSSGIAPVDLALQTGQIRFVPEAVRRSPEMKSHRWTKTNGEIFLMRALQEGGSEWAVTKEDVANPELFWNHDVEGVPLSYLLIKGHALDKVPPGLFRGMPYTYWHDTRINQRSLVGWATQDKYLLKAFFTPRAWTGRLEEMKKTFSWAVEELGAARSVSGTLLQKAFDIKYKEALQVFDAQYKEAQSRTREIERSKKPDVYTSLPGGVIFIPS